MFALSRIMAVADALGINLVPAEKAALSTDGLEQHFEKQRLLATMTITSSGLLTATTKRYRQAQKMLRPSTSSLFQAICWC